MYAFDVFQCRNACLSQGNKNDKRRTGSLNEMIHDTLPGHPSSTSTRRIANSGAKASAASSQLSQPKLTEAATTVRCILSKQGCTSYIRLLLLSGLQSTELNQVLQELIEKSEIDKEASYGHQTNKLEFLSYRLKARKLFGLFN